MIANPTTLILGAGASQPFGYPTGVELRDEIIHRTGIDPYLHALERMTRTNFEAQGKRDLYDRLITRFKRSHVASIDAFLAEPESSEFAEVGRAAIAAALLTHEHPERDPDWYADLFNAIRFRADDERREKLRVVTFNYDLSVEHFLFHAFSNTYNLTPEEARDMFNDNVEVIHVYGDLGELSELSTSNDARAYGSEFNSSVAAIVTASKRIHIIGRHEARRAAFERAFTAIQQASFVAILGYGFDQINNTNLRLQEAVAAKSPYATCYRMGCGTRARLTSLAHQSNMIMGGKHEKVRDFLAETDFLRWINEPKQTGEGVSKKIAEVFDRSILTCGEVLR